MSRYPTNPRTDRRLSSGRRVRDLLRSAIVHEDLDAGALPAETEMMSSFRTSRQVIRDALALLREEGLVRRSQGTGTLSTASMIRHNFDFLHGPHDGSEHVRFKILNMSEEPAPPPVAQRLELDAGSSCGLVETLTVLDAEPLDVTTVYVPTSFLPAVARLKPSAEWFSLYEDAGIELGATDHFIEAAVADVLVAELLEVRPGHPLLMFERLVRDRAGRPLEFAFTRVRGDRLTLVQNMTVSRPPSD